MTRVQSEWFGTEIVAGATAHATEMLTAAAEQGAVLAVQDKWWNARRGEEGLVSEVVAEPARPIRGHVSSQFGSTQRMGFYGLFLELRDPWIVPAGDQVARELLPALRAGVGVP